LERDEIGEVKLAQRIGLAEIAGKIELIEPHAARALALVEKENDRLDARAGEDAAGEIEHRVEIAAFEEELTERDRGVVGVREEGVLDDDARTAARLQDLDEMLEEEEGGLAGLDWEVLLDLGAFLATEGRVREHDVVAVFLLDVGDVLGERIDMDDVRRLDAVEDHVHRPDDVREGFLFLSVKGFLLEDVDVLRREFLRRFQVLEGLAEEACRSHRAVVDAVADLGIDHLHNRADERARGVVLAAVPARVAHVLDLRLVEMTHLVLLGARLELELVDEVDDLAEVVAGLEPVLELAEDLADLVLDRIGAVGIGLKLLEIGIELVVDEVLEVVAGHGVDEVDFSVFLGRGPDRPAEFLLDDRGVGNALELCGHLLSRLKVLEVLEKENPGGLFHVIELA